MLTKRYKLIFCFSFIIFFIFTIFYLYFDDDTYYYYQSLNKTHTYSDVKDNQLIYSVPELKTSSKFSAKVVGADGSIEVDLKEVLAALNAIIGSFDESWIKGDTNLNSQQVAYLKKALPMIICMHLKYPKILVSTAILQNTKESGWSGDPSCPGSNNFFGIKARGPFTEYWKGDMVNSWAVEGAYDNFRKYPDLVTSVMDYGAFLTSNPRYAEAGVFEATDYVSQITRIMDANYAPGSEESYINYAKNQGAFMKVERFDEIADKVREILLEEHKQDNLQDGEWEPEGNSTWLADNGIDTSGFSSKRLKLLYEGYSLVGTYYVYGGTTLPPKKSDGSYDITDEYVYSSSTPPYGIDCSAFTRHCALYATGLDISRTTFTQMVNQNLTKIDASEAKAGDLWYPKSTHVVIFLKDLGNGYNLVLHAPQTFVNGSGPPRDRVRIGNYPKRTGGSYYRVQGIDS